MSDKNTETTDISTVSNNPTDLATIGEISGTMDRPKSLDPDDRAGTEGIEQDEIQLPRLAIAQGLSPQLVPGEAKYIPSLVIGMMFNDVSEEIYGNGPMTLVPVQRHVTRIEFDPNDKKVPLDRDVPAGDPRLKWGPRKADGTSDPPRATEFVEFVCLLLRPNKHPEPIVVSIKTTNKEQRSAAKLFTTYIATRNAAIYSGLYKIATKIAKGKNKKGEDTMYGHFIVKNAGFIPKDTPAGAALFGYAKDFHETLQHKTIVVEREAEDATDFDPAAIESQAQQEMQGATTESDM